MTSMQLTGEPAKRVVLYRTKQDGKQQGRWMATVHAHDIERDMGVMRSSVPSETPSEPTLTYELYADLAGSFRASEAVVRDPTLTAPGEIKLIGDAGIQGNLMGLYHLKPGLELNGYPVYTLISANIALKGQPAKEGEAFLYRCVCGLGEG